MGSNEDLNRLCEQLASDLTPVFGRPGQAIQFYFCRDTDQSLNMVKSLVAPQRMVAAKLQLNLDELFNGKEKHLSKFVVAESIYIVLWTRPSIMSKAESRKAKAERKQPVWWPRADDTQSLFTTARLVNSRHRSLVANFLSSAKAAGLDVEALFSHDALRAMRESIYSGCGHPGWKPVLPGDVPTDQNGKPGHGWVRSREVAPSDMSHLLWPSVPEQLFDKPAEMDNNLVKINGLYYAPIDVSRGPQDIIRFNDLLNRIRETEDQPWRISFLLEGSAISGGLMASMLAPIIGKLSSDNRLYKTAMDGLSQLRTEGVAIPRLRMSLATWAKDRSVAEERAGRLEQAVQTWGSCITTTAMGDPMDGFCSSALGMGVRSTARTGYGPLRSILHMMPWMREGSPFQAGSLLLRTEDGRMFPFQMGSSQQNTFTDLITAPPGSGKSVFVNCANLAFLLSPGAFNTASNKLPRLSIIDVGPTSLGLILLIQEALPPTRRNEALYYKMRMSAEDAINPFDTHLCLRQPLRSERNFLVNFITQLLTPVGEEKAHIGIADLAGLMVDEVYDSLSDKTRTGNPRRYTSGEDLVVDNRLRDIEAQINRGTTWWFLTDLFKERGEYRMALQCQRQAVPRLEDLMAVQNEKVRAEFGTAKTEHGQPLVDAFTQGISTALREYEILTMPTKLDFGDARVISLDLADVALQGGGPAHKQTGVVYMLARHVLAHDFFLSKDDLSSIPEEHHDYYVRLIQDVMETPKRLVMDEFHRTKPAPAARAQVMIDMREGRKPNLQLALISQLMDDFDTDMRDLATGFWNFGVANAKDAKAAQKLFDLSDAATEAITSKLRGPGPRGEGAPVLAVLNMKDGKHEHVLYNTISPQEVWALSTTNEDVAIRSRLYEALGIQEAWRRLSKRYPSGSAKNDVERRSLEMAKRGMQAEEAQRGVIAELVREIIAEVR